MRLLHSPPPLLFPPHCAFCGKVGVRGVCSDCEKTLPYCKTPFHERAEIGACLAPLRYEGAVREALLAYKFHESQSRCTGFGDILAQSVAEHFGGQFDLVTFVPVSNERQPRAVLTLLARGAAEERLRRLCRRERGEDQGRAHSAHRRYSYHGRYAARSRARFTRSRCGERHLRDPGFRGRRLTFRVCGRDSLRH